MPFHNSVKIMIEIQLTLLDAIATPKKHRKSISSGEVENSGMRGKISGMKFK